MMFTSSMINSERNTKTTPPLSPSSPSSSTPSPALTSSSSSSSWCTVSMAPTAASCSTPAKRTSSLKVLLVDDNPINLQLLKRTMRALFRIHQMDMAYDGHQALQLLQHQHYDIVLLDIDMPGLNGIETTRLIRREQHQLSPHTILDSNRTIPIVAVTTSDSLEARKKYQQVGMDACLSKPIKPSQLKSQLLELLGHSSSSLILS